MADPINPIPENEQPIIPENPITDPNVGRLANPGDPQPTNPGDNPPNIDQRVSILEQKVALLLEHTNAPGTSQGGQ